MSATEQQQQSGGKTAQNVKDRSLGRRERERGEGGRSVETSTREKQQHAHREGGRDATVTDATQRESFGRKKAHSERMKERGISCHTSTDALNSNGGKRGRVGSEEKKAYTRKEREKRRAMQERRGKTVSVCQTHTHT